MNDAAGYRTQKSQGDTVRITDRLFRAPPPRRMVAPILILSVLSGYFARFPALSWSTILTDGVVVFGIPTALAVVLTRPLSEGLGGRMYLRRSALLAVLCLATVASVQVAAILVGLGYAFGTGTTFAIPTAKVTLFAYAVVLWVRHVVLAATSNSNHARTLPASSLQTAVGFAGVALVLPVTVHELAAGVLVAGIFLVSGIAFTEIAKRPLSRAFGVDGLKLMRYVLDHMTELGEDGRRELEDFFAGLSVPSRVRVGAVGFRDRAARLKALLIVPTVHPGPMGYVAGSDLPSKLAAQLADLTPNVLVAHGPSTHDENPSTSEECRKVGDAVRGLVAAASPTEESSLMARATVGKATATAQLFGDAAFVVSSLAPNPTDDIDRATGFAVAQEAQLAGIRDAVFADAHNCMQVDSGLTHFGSPESHDIIRACGSAVRGAMAERTRGLRIGVGSRTGFCSPADGLGARGVQALVVETGGRRVAYVLFDGNNMVPALRPRVQERIRDLLADAEILTTDNHSVNVTIGGFNPVGLRFEVDAFADAAEAAVRDALGDLEDADAFLSVGEIEGFRIFGPQVSARLTTTINATVSVLRPAFYVTLALALVGGLLVLSVLP